MRQVVLFVTAALVMALAGPAGAQPFADTPATHWAYDALTELAAKGLIEGYPDGAFKGGQPMTRYEMAMIVARLLPACRASKFRLPCRHPRANPRSAGRTWT